jgi:riboflavin kinase/FMN adenylyltransferase
VTGNGTVLTVGTFDGVHRGHLTVLHEIRRRARATGRHSVLVTFEPHPLEVVRPEGAPPLLTTRAEKDALLARAPVDEVVVVDFTPELRDLPPERFVREVLEQRFAMRELVIGHDHGFGRGRSGDVELLRRVGADDGFTVDVVPSVLLEDGRAISSTLIRRAVQAGDLATAARALGRAYGVMGRVVAGAGRGRTIGVPTVNLEPPPGRKLLPPDGVYAAWVTGEGVDHGAMLNLGARPTFGETVRVLEAHLFGFAGDLYGQMLTVGFLARLRDVQRFGSVDALTEQLEADRTAALDALRKAGRSVTL